MADSKIALITANRITDILKIVTPTYNTIIPYCEQERLTERNNNKYPRVELAGPSVEIDNAADTQGYKYTLEYTAIYKAQLDDSNSTDDAVTYQARNVASDIIKGWMDDHTCGGNAVITYPTESYYTLDFGPNDEPLFSVVVVFKVETYLVWDNPYTIG